MNKSVLLSKHHDITSFASTDPSRYVLQGVHYYADKKLVEACDGRILIRVPVCESDDFPTVKGQCEAQPVDCIIPDTQFKKALGNTTGKNSVPCLNYVRLDANGKITLTATDVDTEQAVTCKPIEGSFPKCDQVVPDWEPTLKYRISARLLKQIADYALKHSINESHYVDFEFKDNKSAFRFSLNIEDLNGKTKATGVGMPVSMNAD